MGSNSDSLEKDPDICINNEDLCDQLCMAEDEYPYYSCACFEGFGFNPDDQRERCIRKCDDDSYWDAKEYRCKPVKQECKLGTNLADLEIRRPGGHYENLYPNIGDVGRGYDLMIADPYNAIVSITS